MKPHGNHTKENGGYSDPQDLRWLIVQCWGLWLVASGRRSLTCGKELPTDEGHDQRGKELKPYNLWKVPTQASPQIAAKTINELDGKGKVKRVHSSCYIWQLMNKTSTNCQNLKMKGKDRIRSFWEREFREAWVPQVSMCHSNRLKHRIFRVVVELREGVDLVIDGMVATIPAQVYIIGISVFGLFFRSHIKEPNAAREMLKTWIKGESWNLIT